MQINKNFVHQVGDQPRLLENVFISLHSLYTFLLKNCLNNKHSLLCIVGIYRRVCNLNSLNDCNINVSTLEETVPKT
jgi:hypothetical protein